MPFRSMEQGISAIKAGNLDEGARLLRIALKSDLLTGSLRATAYLWLAETQDDPQFKETCYREALAADPHNQDAHQRLAALLSAQLPTASTPPAPSVQPASAPRVPASSHIVGIIGGPNGPGTGFFVSRDGLVATTRYIVANLENIRVELAPGRQQPGRVVRAFPLFDLALIRVDHTLNDLLPITPHQRLPDDMPLVAITYTGQRIVGRRRATKRVLPTQWFPTDIVNLADAGGNPVFDSNQYLVGMLTRNTSRSSAYVHGVHIASIHKCVEQYLLETRGNANRVYCPSCGFLSQAAIAGSFYCELCGSVLPHALHVTRYPQPQAAAFYGENYPTPCPHCGARVGFHNQHCLRCGRMLGATP